MKIHGIATPVCALVRNDASVLFFWAAIGRPLSLDRMNTWYREVGYQNHSPQQKNILSAPKVL